MHRNNILWHRGKQQECQSERGVLAFQSLANQSASQLWKILPTSSVRLNTWGKDLSVSILAASFWMAGLSSSSPLNWNQWRVMMASGGWHEMICDRWQDSKMTEKEQMLLYKWPGFQVPTSLLCLFCLYLLFLIFLSASFCLTIIEIQRRKHRNKAKQQNWNRRWKRQNEVCTQDRQKCPTPEMRQIKTWAKKWR